MAHMITETDGFVVNGKRTGEVGERAWHGLGTYVQGIKSADALLQIGGLDWDVQQLPMIGVLPAIGDGSSDCINVESHVLNVRSDNRQILGVVGKGYHPFHNRQLIELVKAMNDGGEAEVETLGSIMGGRRVWALIRGQSFTLRNNDTTQSYLAACTSHDGSLAINLFWTSIRIVCNNTFRAALGNRANGISIRHEGSVMQKVDSAKVALGLMAETTAREAQIAEALDGYQMNRESLQRFFVSVYSTVEGAIPANPSTDAEKRQHAKAAEAIGNWCQMFDADRRRVNGGATMWHAFNAVTEWYDHVKLPQIKNPQAREDARIASALFGTNCDRKQQVREMALAAI